MHNFLSNYIKKDTLSYTNLGFRLKVPIVKNCGWFQLEAFRLLGTDVLSATQHVKSDAFQMSRIPIYIAEKC